MMEFITGHKFDVSVRKSTTVGGLKKLIHEQHGGAQPDAQRILHNDSPVRGKRILWSVS